MAEINDIAYKIVGDIAAAIVPLVGTEYNMPEYIDLTGQTQPTADLSAYGETRTVPAVKIFPSRPMLDDLTKRLEDGKASISIEVADHDIPRPQYSNRPETFVSEAPLTLAYQQSDDTVTLGGSVTAGNVIGLQCGNSSTSYLVKAGDTFSSIATNLAAQAQADKFFPVMAFEGGFTVDIPVGSPPLQVNLGSTQTWYRLVSYRRRYLDALIWSPNPYDRQFLGRQIETLYDLGQRLPMTDGSTATIMDIPGAIDHDIETAEGMLIRRIRWTVDFTPVKTFTKTTIVATIANLSVVGFDSTPALTQPTASQL